MHEHATTFEQILAMTKLYRESEQHSMCAPLLSNILLRTGLLGSDLYMGVDCYADVIGNVEEIRRTIMAMKELKPVPQFSGIHVLNPWDSETYLISIVEVEKIVRITVQITQEAA